MEECQGAYRIEIHEFSDASYHVSVLALESLRQSKQNKHTVSSKK